MAISRKIQKQREYADRLWLEQRERKIARDPSAPLSAKLYPNTRNAALLEDAKRGSVSPLGGQAQPKGKER
jgi:hypothetical protein